MGHGLESRHRPCCAQTTLAVRESTSHKAQTSARSGGALPRCCGSKGSRPRWQRLCGIRWSRLGHRDGIVAVASLQERGHAPMEAALSRRRSSADGDSPRGGSTRAGGSIAQCQQATRYCSHTEIITTIGRTMSQRPHSAPDDAAKAERQQMAEGGTCHQRGVGGRALCLRRRC